MIILIIVRFIICWSVGEWLILDMMVKTTKYLKLFVRHSLFRILQFFMLLLLQLLDFCSWYERQRYGNSIRTHSDPCKGVALPDRRGRRLIQIFYCYWKVTAWWYKAVAVLSVQSLQLVSNPQTLGWVHLPFHWFHQGFHCQCGLPEYFF